MQTDGHEIISKFRPAKIILPVIIGLGVALYLFLKEFDREAYSKIDWTVYTTFWILLALVMMILRDVSYMYRIKVLSGNFISWRRSFPVIMLWEFSSAVTPTMVGGTALAFFILNREGLRMGRSIAVVLTTSFLDEMFFVLAVPLVFLFVGKSNLFVSLDPSVASTVTSMGGMYYFFWMGYAVLLAYTLLVAYAIFVNPRAVKWLLLKFFSLPLLRKWRQQAWQSGNDMIVASGELRDQPRSYWIKSFGATILSWTARYMVINCIIMAFITHGLHENIVIYARQLVMWIIMLVSPTPGASGIAEVIFSRFLSEFTPAGVDASIALLWRLISYYPYLFIGVIILPRWVRRNVITRSK
ncbi:MAG TPA: lysylphosphatidylglycerol synthase transmembrane domain-containing protein [Bacteroidia bacterium]|nr:lysylphosphatidylglycerol synthase transmembrane domain-containing protein [Bacteroidia bacterium]